MKPILLLVDDDQSVLAALNKLLKMEGFEILLARTASQAIELFTTNRVDLTVLDLNLGEENGWNVLETINGINPSVPTIIITAEFGQRANASAAGAEALIEKPIDVPSFLEAIRAILAAPDRKRSQPTAAQEERCRYVVRLYDPVSRLLEERHSTPLKLSKALRDFLSAVEQRPTRTHRTLSHPPPEKLSRRQKAKDQTEAPISHRAPHWQRERKSCWQRTAAGLRPLWLRQTS